MTHLEGFEQLLSGNQPKPKAPQAETAMEGTITAVFATQAIFTIPEFGPNSSFGPAPFGRTDNPPMVGDECLVIFIGTGIDRAWIVDWRVPD